MAKVDWQDWVAIGLEAGTVLTRALIAAFSRGDETEIKRLSEILPDRLRSRVLLEAKEAAFVARLERKES